MENPLSNPFVYGVIGAMAFFMLALLYVSLTDREPEQSSDE